jgi:hypothetical protein
MAKLNTADRKAMPKADFAVPSQAPGSGSYPINDAAHARNALARVSGNGSPAVKAQVRSAVPRKFPGIGAKVQNRPGTSLEQMADRMHPVGGKRGG